MNALVATTIESPDAPQLLSVELAAQIKVAKENGKMVCLVCIGTDRCTGDSLGPLVGWRLEKWGVEGIQIHGTLDYPVHADNLGELAEQLSRREDVFVIAVNACLGEKEDIGRIVLRSGPAEPGIGVGKTLPKIGDIRILGIVNVGGFMEYKVLGATPLSRVMRMADIIATAIKQAAATKEGK